jgi:hypothetical protein
MNHYLPEELAKQAGMTRTEVIKLCHEMDVPIFQGRIDRTLFDEALSEYRLRHPGDVRESASG